jgi:hypothetical protein
MRRLILAGTAVLAAAPSLAHANATIVINNLDGPNEGFNDPTPAAPVGGNTGTTIGQQRLIAFQYAADVWANLLDSAVTIRIDARFDPQTCDMTGAVLGSAGATTVHANFTGALQPNTWYPQALANRLAFTDLAPSNSDLSATFNANLGTSPTCPFSWYYGLDGQSGGDEDLVIVLLHEMGHGLGFQTFVNKSTGAWFGPPAQPDSYGRLLFDNTAALAWPAMSNAQRAASVINSRNLVIDGPATNAAVPTELALGVPLLNITVPAAASYDVGTADFGPALTAGGVTGNLIVANDGMNPTRDACQPLTGGPYTGRIVLVDRGACGFGTKAINVQNAGGIAMVMANSVADTPPANIGCGPPDPCGSVTIPSVMITQAAGNTLRTQIGMGTVTGTLQLDTSRRAGADAAGRALVWSPNPMQPGSSVSH